jgi:hypothetical protein
MVELELLLVHSGEVIELGLLQQLPLEVLINNGSIIIMV